MKEDNTIERLILCSSMSLGLATELTVHTICPSMDLTNRIVLFGAVSLGVASGLFVIYGTLNYLAKHYGVIHD